MGHQRLLDGLKGMRAVVVGDVMLDEYIVGTVDRVSPEAPVMVVKKRSSRWVPGGAANVAKNISALGGFAMVLGVVGDDAAGELLAGKFEADSGVKCNLVVDKKRVTTRKTRVVANHSHQVLRIDEEETAPITPSMEDKVLESWLRWLETADVLVMSDYRKGLLTPKVCSVLIDAANKRGIPSLANAKPDSAGFFAGANLVSLNRGEVAAVTGTLPKNRAEAAELGRILSETTQSDAVLMTLGEEGMVAWSASETHEVPAPQVEAYDVAGAGDTVLATVSLGMAKSGFTRGVFELAAEVGAKVVQHIGVAVPSSKDLDAIRSL